MRTNTESSLACVAAAITAFVAVSPCPSQGVAVYVFCISAVVAIIAFMHEEYALMLAAGLAYTAFSIRSRHYKAINTNEDYAKGAAEILESFSKNVPEKPVEQSEDLDYVDIHRRSLAPVPERDRVAETMTKELLRDFITPELLEAAQSNEV